MKSILRSIAMLAAFLPLYAHATPTMTANGNITLLKGGWSNSSMVVQLDIPFANPAGCPWTDFYEVSYQEPGNALFTSMLLSAYMARRKIALTLDGCTNSRPRVIGVDILPN